MQTHVSMGSIFQLRSSSDYYLNANYFDPKDNNIYVHRLTDSAAAGGKERWEYTAAIGETQEFKELELSSGVVIRGEKLAELVGDLRPAAATHDDTSSSRATSFYSLRVNNEGRCYIRSDVVGDFLHGSRLNATFDWSKYGAVVTRTSASTTSEEKWKVVAEEKTKELEACLLKLKEVSGEKGGEEKELAGSGGEGEEEGYWEVSSTWKEGRVSRPGFMDCSAVLVVVFYFLGLYYWGAKLLAVLFRKRSQNTQDNDGGMQ
ncbi:unnamed protein product [Linum trigynum]|uniref:Uncharacterized protein n=1 Tax=Linum trigynum TaxID=586398 RepID=A0AAV2FYV1_9ROSI